MVRERRSERCVRTSERCIVKKANRSRRTVRRGRATNGQRWLVLQCPSIASRAHGRSNRFATAGIGIGRSHSDASPLERAGAEARVVGDFLIESKCKRGHASAASFRGYTRDQVENVARELDPRCNHPQDPEVVSDSDTCDERVAHVVSVLSMRHPVSYRTTTKPSMGAVRPSPPVFIVHDEEPSNPSPEYDEDAETSTNRPQPPPSTEDERH